MQVIECIRAVRGQTELLVIDAKADRFFHQHRLPLSSSLPFVTICQSPPPGQYGKQQQELQHGIALLRAKAECFARLSHRLGVCLSVCPSVTLVICIKTVQARITKSLLWAAPRSLVYRDKISCHWVQVFPSNESVKDNYPLKSGYFTAIISCSVNTVADKHRHAAYHNKHWWQAF